MKKSDPIVIFANPVYQGEGLASTVELAKEMARHQDVLFINFPMTYTQLFKGQERGRLKRALGFAKRLYRPNKDLDKLWVLEMPLMLPSNKIRSKKVYNQVLSRNNRTYKQHLLGAMQRLNWSSTIAVNAFNPLYKEAFLSFSALKHVYYCYDNIEAAYWLAEHGVPLEQELVKHSDEIYVSSQGLFAKFSGSHKPLTWIPNGMNPKDFTRNQAFAEHQLHAAYIGALDDRLDYPLLHNLLEANPALKMTLVGPVKCAAAQELTAMERVNYLGVKRPDEVGEHLQDCTIGLIPFVKNDFTSFIYPLKINEYLSLGMAVLTTDFADLSVFEDWVRPVSSAQEAVMELARIEAEELHEKAVTARITFAQSQSWEARADKMRMQLNG